MTKPAALAAALCAALLAACDDGIDQPLLEQAGAQEAAPKAAPVFTPAAANQARFTPEVATAADRTPAVLRAQVLLDRARFSPGVIDGTAGENLRQAIAAFEEANGLAVDGKLDEAVFARLTELDPRPVMAEYLVTAADVAGPFIGTVPEELEALSRLPALGYATPAEALAEKFHMTEELLVALNPGVDFAVAGTRILVADRGSDRLEGKIARIDVLKGERAVRIYDASDRLLCFYQATIGSEVMPTHEGTLKVLSVAHEPSYTYDPARLNFGGSKTKLTLAAGPNNPVGSVWIDLSRDTYGIHGADEPKEIGKRFSHGCVRLTNWDAEEIASAVKAGVTVRFLDA